MEASLPCKQQTFNRCKLTASQYERKSRANIWLVLLLLKMLIEDGTRRQTFVSLDALFSEVNFLTKEIAWLLTYKLHEITLMLCFFDDPAPWWHA